MKRQTKSYFLLLHQVSGRESDQQPLEKKPESLLTMLPLTSGCGPVKLKLYFAFLVYGT